MPGTIFDQFLASADTLQIYKENELLFSSDKDRLFPLLEYLEKLAPCNQQVTVFDKVTGNAAALLSIKAGSQEVYSPLGSQLAIETFEEYGVKYHITKIIPYIKRADGKDMCPMEKLSIGKTPEEFYQALKNARK